MIKLFAAALKSILLFSRKGSLARATSRIISGNRSRGYRGAQIYQSRALDTIDKIE
jgi:hypothetical protein